MFDPNGNPSAQNLFGVIAALQKAEGVSVELQMHSHYRGIGRSAAPGAFESSRTCLTQFTNRMETGAGSRCFSLRELRPRPAV